MATRNLLAAILRGPRASAGTSATTAKPLRGDDGHCLVPLVSAILAGILLATPLGAAHAAEDCLSGPNAQAPEGGHWYYRIDHATRRHCWYIGEQRDNRGKPTRAIPPNSAQAASPEAEPAIQPSVANARAELSPQTRVEQPAPPDALTQAIQANAAREATDPALAAIQSTRAVLATRWPDPANPNLPTGAAPASPDNGASLISAGPPAIGLAAANAASEPLTYSATMQLAAALIAALALAGMIGSVVFKRGDPQRPARVKIRPRRGAIWESTDDDSIHLAADPETGPLPRRRGFARNVDRAGNRDDRIAEFFSQLAKRRPT